MKTITTKGKITLLSLLSLVLISITCKKRFTQTDVNNARNEGIAAAQPSEEKLNLLKIQKEFLLKSRRTIYSADTIHRNLLLQSKTKTGTYYNFEVAKVILDRLSAQTAKTINTTFGKPTNTDPGHISMTLTHTEGGNGNTEKGLYTEIVFGFAKLVKKSNGNDDTTDFDDSHKSSVRSIGSHTFTLTATTPETPIYTANIKSSALNNGKTEGGVPDTGDENSFYALTLTWEYKGKKEEIAKNLYTAPNILLAFQEALTRAIAVTK